MIDKLMRAKKIVCFFSVLFFSGLICSADALPDATVSLRGGRVTIDLAYPEEAPPNTTIAHYVNITSSTVTTLRAFTVVIKAPLENSSWQVIFNGTNNYGIPPELPQNYTLPLTLPQDANGMLQCAIFVNTSSIEDLSATFYTTLVSKPTFSEMLANYTSLQAEYENMLNDYNELLANYNNLLANYTALLSAHNQLLADYNSKASALVVVSPVRQAFK